MYFSKSFKLLPSDKALGSESMHLAVNATCRSEDLRASLTCYCSYVLLVPLRYSKFLIGESIVCYQNQPAKSVHPPRMVIHHRALNEARALNLSILVMFGLSEFSHVESSWVASTTPFHQFFKFFWVLVWVLTIIHSISWTSLVVWTPGLMLWCGGTEVDGFKLSPIIYPSKPILERHLELRGWQS